MENPKFGYFLKSKVAFLPFIDIELLNVEAEVLDNLLYTPHGNELTIVWYEQINGSLLDSLKEKIHSRLIVIINQKSPDIRRAEMLLSSNIDRIYSYTGEGAALNNEDFYTICMETLASKRVDRNKGITRILKINEKNKPEARSLTCTYKEGTIVEYFGNLNIASLQLKGKRASALFVDDIEKTIIDDLSRILSKDSENQVLLNTHDITEDKKKILEENGHSFMKINAEKLEELIDQAVKMELPTLHDNVWKSDSTKAGESISELLSKDPLKSDCISLESTAGRKADEELYIKHSTTIADSLTRSRLKNLLYYKNIIVTKPVVILNSKETGIQKELLTILYKISHLPHLIIAAGDKDHYRLMMEAFKEFRANKFYKKKDISLLVCNPGDIPQVLMQVASTEKEPEPVEEVKEVLTEDLKKPLIKPAERLAEECNSYVSIVEAAMKTLSEKCDLVSQDSDKKILKNLFKIYSGQKSANKIFSDTDEKILFKKFLTSITPDTSKTEFPDNLKDLLLIMKSIIFLIVDSKESAHPNIQPVLEKIKQTNLTLTSLKPLIEHIKNRLVTIESVIKKEPVSEEFLEALILHSRKLDHLIYQSMLQTEFSALAAENISDTFKIKLNNIPSQKNNMSPFREIIQFEQVIKNIQSQQRNGR